MKVYLTALVAVNILGGCSRGDGVRNCKSVDYCGLKAIWHTDITCTPSDKQSRCKQLQLAYYRDTDDIDLQQDLNHPIGSKDNWTVLMVASHQGHDKLVKMLLDNGAIDGINMQDKCGWSALMFAAFTGSSINVVKLLLEYGARINQLNSDSRSALFLASGKGHVKIVELLLQYGANPRHEDRWGIPVITVGVYYCGFCHPQVVRAFLRNCDNDEEHLHGALWAATYDYCCPAIVRDLIQFGAPTHDKDRMMFNPNPKCKNCQKDCEESIVALTDPHFTVQKNPCNIRHTPYTILPPRISEPRTSESLQGTSGNVPLFAVIGLFSILFFARICKYNHYKIIRPRNTLKRVCHSGPPPPPPSPEQQPTMQELTNFCGKINILSRISTHYRDFGIHLLEDSESCRVDGLEHEHSRNAYSINQGIAIKWLKGEGKKPISWTVLIETLRDIGLIRLAEDIKNRLK